VKRVLLPFDLPNFEFINSNHPLLACLTLPRYDGVEFVPPLPEPPAAAFSSEVFGHAARFAETLAAGTRHLPRNDRVLLKFLETRDLYSQSRLDLSADLAFFHTAPMLMNQMPYILHFENFTTLFNPFLVAGETGRIELRKEYVFWFVRAMLESEQCRGIFTNLALSKGHLDKAFASEVISRKTRHVPAGTYFTTEEDAKIAAGLERKRDKDEVEILFTNSWHQRSPSFFLRGGLDLVMAFLMIEQQLPNVRLILRTAWPPHIEGTDLTKTVREHPKITLLPDKLSDEEILDLFVRADVFFLDAASVHSISILRAMYCGAACIVSDAPGYDEYVTHGESALIVPGRRAAVYSEDPDTGWLRSDFKPMFDMNQERLRLLAGVLQRLCANREARLKLGMNARQRVMTRNSFAGWRDGFEAVLRNALVG
jgi:glycosyltransferase involved in cell wall biosynthesis